MVQGKKTKKKTVKKKAVKKKTAKKTTKKVSKKALRKAQGDQCFFVIDGRVVDNLLDLANSFEDMSDDVFNHHVNDSKNDFANWIKEVMQEANLAEDIFNAQDKRDHQVKLMRFIVHDLK